MKVIFLKDYKKENGGTIHKGTQADMLKESALELIDKKVVRSLNIIDKAKNKLKEISETKETDTPPVDETKETRETKKE